MNLFRIFFKIANHYCQLCMANGTQLEHQDLAIKCNKALLGIMPELFTVDQTEMEV